MPAFPISVPHELYDATADVLGEEWADSYLYGAICEGGNLLPRTQMAWSRMLENTEFMKILVKQQWALIKPPRFNGTPAVIELGYEQPTRRRRK